MGNRLCSSVVLAGNRSFSDSASSTQFQWGDMIYQFGRHTLRPYLVNALFCEARDIVRSRPRLGISSV